VRNAAPMAGLDDKEKRMNSVLAGAIVIVEANGARDRSISIGNRIATLADGPIACVEILGGSMLARTIERFVSSSGVETISVLGDAEVSRFISVSELFSNRVKFQIADDVYVAAAEALNEFAERGIEQAFICTASAYTECDLADLLQFHRDRRQSVTRSFDGEGALDLWVVDCARVQETGLAFLFAEDEAPELSSYFVKEYVNRLMHPADLRRLVTDALCRRCNVQPLGREVRPGIWVGENAQIHKRARIVAPAYIGRGARIREDSLITRCSNVESLSHIDYGTVIEDSSILSGSYVGIWLDVSHAIVRGNRLLHLGRNVVLEISDSSVIREIVAAPREAQREPVPIVTPAPLAFAPSE
jgi:NDP-sugar pyrophosphorylase family protein